MINYIIVVAISVILALVSNMTYIFFIMVDKDEEEYYKEIGTGVPFEDIRGDELLGVLFVISVFVCKFVANLIGIKAKWVYYISIATIVSLSFLTGKPLERLYYKIKYKRYPHLNPDAKNTEESDNE